MALEMEAEAGGHESSRAEATRAYGVALELGLPILQPFFEAAWAAAEHDGDVARARYAPAARALAPRRVRDQIWTAFFKSQPAQKG
jgi:hypothetical protein